MGGDSNSMFVEKGVEATWIGAKQNEQRRIAELLNRWILELRRKKRQNGAGVEEYLCNLFE